MIDILKKNPFLSLLKPYTFLNYKQTTEFYIFHSSILLTQGPRHVGILHCIACRKGIQCKISFE